MIPTHKEQTTSYRVHCGNRCAAPSQVVDAAELNAIFAEQVMARAKKRKWSVNRLADFAGVSRGYLSLVLRGKKTPTLRTVAAVATALEVEPWTLLKPAPATEK